MIIAYPMNAAVEAELFVSTIYLTAVAWYCLSLFGLVRTVATRLPIPSGYTLGVDLDPELYPADFHSPKLYSFSSPSRKWVKAAVLFVQAAYAGLCIYVMLRYTANARMDWLGWNLLEESYVWAAHLVLLAIASYFLASRAVSHANKFPTAVSNDA